MDLTGPHNQYISCLYRRSHPGNTTGNGFVPEVLIVESYRNTPPRVKVSDQALMKPARIQRKRTPGYNIQVESREVNGLDCIAVTRPGKWGNPYHITSYGRPLALAVFRNSALGMWNPNLLAGQPKIVFEAIYAAHMKWLKRLGGHPLEMIRKELRGCNLSCYCDKSVGCHADIYLEILNKEIAAS